MPRKINTKSRGEIDEDQAISLLATIADPAKLRIARLLANQQSMRSGDIAGKFAISRTTVSHHLAIMKMRGLVKTQKKGKEVYYSLNKDHVIGTLNSIICFLEK